jgi:hypothetical protein
LRRGALAIGRLGRRRIAYRWRQRRMHHGRRRRIGHRRRRRLGDRRGPRGTRQQSRSDSRDGRNSEDCKQSRIPLRGARLGPQTNLGRRSPQKVTGAPPRMARLSLFIPLDGWRAQLLAGIAGWGECFDARPLTLPAMRLAHAPLKSVARKFATGSPLPQGERGAVAPPRVPPLSPRVLGRGFPQDGSLLIEVDMTLISLVFREIDVHAGTS